jgi:hypothetical protein
MGFRNPLTSIGNVDTGAGGSSGARMYGDTSGVFPTGVVEWYTPYGTAQATATVAATDQGGGSYTTTGATTRFRGMPDSHKPAGWLDLNVEGLSAGGYEARSRLRGDRVILEAPAGMVDSKAPGYIRDNRFPDPVVIATFAPGWAAWTDDVYRKLRFTLLPTGMVHVTGVVTYTGAGTPATKICALTNQFAPEAREMVNGCVQDAFRQFDVLPDGLYLRGALPTVNQFVAVNGVYFAAGRHTSYPY